MKRTLKRLLSLLLTAALAVSVVSVPSFAADTDTETVTMSVTYGQTEARSMLDLINEFRTGDDAWVWNEDNTEQVYYTNLEPLEYDYELEASAMQRAAEIALSYSHTRPNGTSCFTVFPSYRSAGENIAAGYSSASAVFTGWQETDESYSGQGHRRNMLSSSFTAVGIGHVICNGVHYWVQNFRSTWGTVTTTYVDPSDGVTDVTIEVQMTSSDTASNLTVGPSALTLSRGETVSLPELTCSLTMANTWPSVSRTVHPEGTWTVEDSSCVSLSDDGTITGAAIGTTSLTGTALGLTITIPVTVNAEEETAVLDSGTCGENLTWVLTEDGTLTISGEGAMTDWSSSSEVPWDSNCSSITSVVVEDGVTSIGDSAFEWCENLTSVTISNSVTSINNWSFAYCVSLTSVTIPASVTSIGSSAFSDCTNLTSATIPDSVTSIDDYAFAGCIRLSSVTIPNSVTSIGDGVFLDCIRLTSVTIPDSVTSIGDGVFLDCIRLTSVTIPASVTSIGDDAFAGCTDLTIYGYLGTAAETYANENGFPFVALDEDTPVENPFPDVSESDYFYDPVLWAYTNGITTGRTQSDGTVIFMPNDYCTRAQAVTFLWRAMGEPEPATKTNPFTDIYTTDYYYKAVLWAYENGITTGKNPGSSALLFGPNDSCTRAQIVTFLWRAEGKPGHTISNPFPDVADGGTFTDAILWAYENGVTTGRTQSDGTVIFMPNDYCTRAQIVTFLYRDMVE